ncbi:hypothetical protein HCG49_05035 [Arenibacter sp. 6A1]|uniref:hypothetical protein n=1 Tax=Arenibacter sp. 6A1 TaxID=2720391 RepID=UPI001448A251|nr:hypothetical protein [Arenibacter sp. 6A1]NKI25919.1 hypothetical protein [Arenibacter sp. 6A1]
MLSEDFFNNPKTEYKSIEHIKGLDTFKRQLEKYFFSDFNIHNYGTPHSAAKLVIEIECNFSLSEALHHLMLRNRNSEGTAINSKEITFYFSWVLKKLKQANNFPIDISEITVFFEDTTLLISKIYDQSIPEQLDEIFNKLIEHSTYYTNGGTVVPFEIFIPVFEDKTAFEYISSEKISSKTSKDYYKYWGIYGERSEECVVYNLETKSIIIGDINVLTP